MTRDEALQAYMEARERTREAKKAIVEAEKEYSRMCDLERAAWLEWENIKREEGRNHGLLR